VPTQPQKSSPMIGGANHWLRKTLSIAKVFTPARFEPAAFRPQRTQDDLAQQTTTLICGLLGDPAVTPGHGTYEPPNPSCSQPRSRPVIKISWVRQHSLSTFTLNIHSSSHHPSHHFPSILPPTYTDLPIPNAEPLLLLFPVLACRAILSASLLDCLSR
jgi:hypothetical protein